MLNVLVAIKIWSEQLNNKTVVIHCDNLAILQVLQSCHGHDKYLLAVARNIWLYTTKYYIKSNIVHIPGKSNVVADLLSRWHKRDNHALLHHIVPNYWWVTINNAMHTLDYDI